MWGLNTKSSHSCWACSIFTSANPYLWSTEVCKVRLPVIFVIVETGQAHFYIHLLAPAHLVWYSENERREYLPRTSTQQCVGFTHFQGQTYILIPRNQTSFTLPFRTPWLTVDRFVSRDIQKAGKKWPPREANITTKAGVKTPDADLKVWYREKSERCDTVDDPGGRGRPHFAPPNHRGLVRTLAVKDDVLGAEGLVGSRQSVVGGSTEGLSDITVGFGSPTQQLTSSVAEQLGQLLFSVRLKRAQEEEEAAVEQRRQLRVTRSERKWFQVLALTERFLKLLFILFFILMCFFFFYRHIYGAFGAFVY